MLIEHVRALQSVGWSASSSPIFEFNCLFALTCLAMFALHLSFIRAKVIKIIKLYFVFERWCGFCIKLLFANSFLKCMASDTVKSMDVRVLSMSPMPSSRASSTISKGFILFCVLLLLPLFASLSSAVLRPFYRRKHSIVLSRSFFVASIKYDTDAVAYHAPYMCVCEEHTHKWLLFSTFDDDGSNNYKLLMSLTTSTHQLNNICEKSGNKIMFTHSFPSLFFFVDVPVALM